MLIFWIILFWTGIFSILLHYIIKREVEGIHRNTLIFISILICFFSLIFFASMRSVVSDTMAYTNFYNQIPTDISKIFDYSKTMKKDTFFWIVSMLFKCFISENYHVWFFAITFICCILIAKSFTRYSSIPMLSTFMFILTCNFTWLFNGMRQFLAVCITFYALRYIIENSFVKYMLLIIVASLIHSTAIIMLPVFFIVKGDIGNKKVIFSMIVFTIIIVNLQNLLPIFDDLLSNTEYDNVISQFAIDDGVNKIKILISLVPIILFIVFKNNYINEIPNYIKVIFNLTLMNLLITILGTFTSGIYVGRLTIYFEISQLLLYPWIFRNLLIGKNYYLIYPSYIVFYFIYYYYQMVITWDGFGYVSDVLNIYLR